MPSSSQQHPLPLPQSARDDVYSHMIASRAVARAATSLGLEEMSQQTLDTLGGVLMAYLQRIGQRVAQNVQASGRSSAHANVLDALRAVEQCTSRSAVRSLQFAAGNTNSNTVAVLTGDMEDSDETVHNNKTSDHQNLLADTSWKGLAAFLFGPDWQQQQPESLIAAAAVAPMIPTTAMARRHGKVGPSASSMNNPSDAAFSGWNAPYPDEVPAYPLVLGDAAVANPHALPEQVGRSLQQVTELDADDANMTMTDTTTDLPDQVLTSDWGLVVKAHGKKRGADDMMDVDDDDGDDDADAAPPAAKKLKMTSDGNDNGALNISRDRLLVPVFLPDYPTTTMSRTVVDRVTGIDNMSKRSTTKPVAAMPMTATSSSSSTLTTADPSRSVRSALVSLDRNEYWGSGWQQQPQNDNATVAVPAGRSEPATTTTTAAPPTIVPVARASGSRVSKILEGSMEPAAAV